MHEYKALSIFGGAKCTLECKYCYIKKTEEIKNMDKDLMKWLEDPQIPDIINTDEVTVLSLWGGEPTLHLDIIADNFDKYKTLFPNLTDVSISSNMTYPKHFDKFAKALSENKLGLSLQISDDGLFNEENRGFKTETLMNNTIKIIKTIAKHKCNFTYHFKSTGSIDNFKTLTNDDKAFEYFSHFNEFAGMIKEVVGDNFVPMGIGESIICPGAYTSNDGKIFSDYLNNTYKLISDGKFKDLKNIIPILVYTDRWLNSIDRMKDFTNRQREFTCSAGDSNVSIDTMNGMHLCHRPLYFVYDAHVKSIASLDNDDNDDVDYLKSGIVDVYKKYYKLDHKFMKLHLRSLHDNHTHRICNATATIMEAACSDQISPIYKDKRAAEVLALFLNACSYCPIENFFITSSWHITPLSVIRLFGNGAFELINELISPKRISE